MIKFIKCDSDYLNSSTNNIQKDDIVFIKDDQIIYHDNIFFGGQLNIYWFYNLENSDSEYEDFTKIVPESEYSNLYNHLNTALTASRFINEYGGYKSIDKLYLGVIDHMDNTNGTVFGALFKITSLRKRNSLMIQFAIDEFSSSTSIQYYTIAKTSDTSYLFTAHHSGINEHNATLTTPVNSINPILSIENVSSLFFYIKQVYASDNKIGVLKLNGEKSIITEIKAEGTDTYKVWYLYNNKMFSFIVNEHGFVNNYLDVTEWYEFPFSTGSSLTNSAYPVDTVKQYDEWIFRGLFGIESNDVLLTKTTIPDVTSGSFTDAWHGSMDIITDNKKHTFDIWYKYDSGTNSIIYVGTDITLSSNYSLLNITE